MTELAINGGPKAKPTPYNRPNRYGEEELRHLAEAIEAGGLMYTAGSKVREFEEAAQKAFGCEYVIGNSSGTAACHTAAAAVGVAEGDEVITTPMTDAGVLSAILAQHAVPVFADIDLDMGITDPASAEGLITEKTRAILVVHLGGNVADMDAFMAIGQRHGVAIIEDCSQAHMSKWRGTVTGTIGDIGAFSMNESKHMSTGDGGFCTTNDPEIARLARLFTDKTYIRDGTVRGDQPLPFMGLNYRPNCLSAAVALAQLHKVEANVARRAEIGRRYFEELGDLPHLVLPKVLDGAEPAWWPLMCRYTADEPPRHEIVAAITAEGVGVSTSGAPARNLLHTELVRNKRFYPCTDEVPRFWRDTVYDPDSCPKVDEMNRTCLRLPMDYRYTDEDISQTIEGIRKVWRHYLSDEG